MASSTSGMSGADETRYRSYITQLERQQDADIKDKETEHQHKVALLTTTNAEQENNLRKDYDVRISTEAEQLEKKLTEVREHNKAIVAHEKEVGEEEATKTHQQYAQKIEQEKKIGDDQIAKMQAFYRKANDDLHQQFERDRAKAALKGKTA